MPRNVALIILFDQDKKILLQHRAEDAKRLPGYWGFFGGGIDQGETPEQAVRRETMEVLKYIEGKY
ncbi:MAG: NUDIX domain-containing protein [bacterium]|nr:NUDIX domain-containing protein [bacterium]